ncbi:MAG: hypothetical protein WCG62_06680, partial [Actinomycetes bacterium]
MRQPFHVEAIASQELEHLRRRVLRGDNASVMVGDPRDDDPASIHLAIRVDGAVVACGSFFQSISPMNFEDPC